jgi:multidrug efflux pump subunit AcrA (membrane-fusion protein)
VLAVNQQNVIEERHVRLGVEDETRVEVVDGLSEQDRVVIGSHTQFRNGERVRPKEVSAGNTKAEGEK